MKIFTFPNYPSTKNINNLKKYEQPEMTYISLVEGMRQRRCSYTRDVRKMGVTLRQLFIIMSEKCHGVRQDKWAKYT
uniref:Uncharacterized protein n=1 Tax=Sphaeramia orbicularis TaxID=375764 RepID=A0A673AEZ1_9TELE